MAVVLSEDGGKVLLLRREILIFWDLPGGGIEPGESPADAAVRECREETGVDIATDRLVGTYRHQSVYGFGDQLTHVYRAHATGGTPRRIGLEITGLRWCSTQALPRGLQPLQRRMIMDALEDRPEPCDRRLPFPLWKLIPARVAFNIVRAVNNTLRLFLPKSH